MLLRALVSFALVVVAAAPLAAQCVNAGLPFGSGCGHSTPFGIPVASCAGAPSLGNPTFGFNTTAPCIASGGLLLLGPCLPAPFVFTSGFGPGGLCGPSEATCALFVDPVCVLTGIAQGSGFLFPAPVPNHPSLVGLQLCVQGANICSGMGCIAMTQGIQFTLF